MIEKTSMGEEILDTVELRETYGRQRPKYERLIHIVTLILTSSLEKKGIKVHSLAYRVKDYNSFLEKIERKRYSHPFTECTDLAGCRVVCLFQSQIDDLKKMIEQEFQVVEVSDKKTLKRPDQFGYLSLHMLVKLPKSRSSLVECNGLEGMVCEIQIRSILQEAWSEIEHYLNYKSAKEEKDEALLRKIYSLAGMFEVADSTFEDINKGFSKLITKKVDIDKDSITAINLFRFCQEYFPWYTTDWSKKEERIFLKLSEEMRRLNIKSVHTIRELIKKYHKDLEKYEKYHMEKENKAIYGSRYFSPVGLVRAALALEYGPKFDLMFGLKGYSDKVRREIGSLD